MEGVRKIGFEEALASLQEHLHRHLRIQISFRGTFAGASIEGRLTRVQTLPPDHSAVAVFLDDRQSLMLDPIDTEVSVIVDGDESTRLLRFHLPSRVDATVEPFAAPAEKGTRQI